MFSPKSKKTYLVAEIGWNFLGNLDLAKKMIKSAKDSGADAVKFQIWNPDNLKPGPWDSDGRRELYKKSFLNKEKYKKLFNYSKSIGIFCFASIWSTEDLKILKSVSNKVVKIPSPEAYNIKLIKESLNNFKEVIISCGCLKFHELKNILKLKKRKNLTVLHCVSSYPLDAKECNFTKFFYLKKFFKKVGYSGHFDGISDAVFAIANGAFIVEKHFTINKKLSGRDNKFSLTVDQFKKLSTFRDNFQKFRIDKGLSLQKNELDINKNYRGRWIK
jgi:sialic acid synthase SpsE